jgi:hypothetical protein
LQGGAVVADVRLAQDGGDGEELVMGEQSAVVLGAVRGSAKLRGGKLRGIVRCGSSSSASSSASSRSRAAPGGSVKRIGTTLQRRRATGRCGRSSTT